MAVVPTIITTIFLLVVLSYYILLFIPQRKRTQEKKFSSVTVIIPAHNEELYIKECIESVLAAEWYGTKQIIVMDDGSKDKTAAIAKKFKEITLIRTKHSGKAHSLNLALRQARGEMIAVVDADGTIGPGSLLAMAVELGKKNTAAVACPIRVKNRKRFILMWVHIEQLYNSLMRLIMSKINANVATPGPLSCYRRKALSEIGGFSTEGFSEDLDITIRLIRAGYHAGFAVDAYAETNMPEQSKWFLWQRARFARGMINIFKRHLRLNSALIDIYTLPLLVFTYIQAIIMGSFTLYQIISGYIVYWASQGVYFNFDVLRFLFEWMSIYGFGKWAVQVASGTVPLDFAAAVGIISTLLSYPLYFYVIFKFDKKINIWHIIPLIFMAPFWWFIMLVYILMLPEVFRKKQYNIWKKND